MLESVSRWEVDASCRRIRSWIRFIVWAAVLEGAWVGLWCFDGGAKSILVPSRRSPRASKRLLIYSEARWMFCESIVLRIEVGVC